MSLYFHQLATPAEAVEIAKGLRPTLRAAEDADMRQYIALIHKEANSD
jgi:hypothetical protein